MIKRTQSPHDAYFRRYLSNPSALRDFLQIILPTSILSVVNLSSLQIQSPAFVDGDLRHHQADLVVSLASQDNRECLIFLLEQQSISDPDMPVRMLRYEIAITEAPTKKIPLVPSFVRGFITRVKNPIATATN